MTGERRFGDGDGILALLQDDITTIVADALRGGAPLERVMFVLYGGTAYAAFERALAAPA